MTPPAKKAADLSNTVCHISGSSEGIYKYITHLK